MEQTLEQSIFIFRRDLRLADNSGLINALTNSTTVVPCFFLDPRLLHQTRVHYNAIQFMIEALEDVDQQLQELNSKVHYFYGLPQEILPTILQSNQISGVFFNRDYTPFSSRRDDRIIRICNRAGVECQQFSDSLLNEPEMILKTNQKPYKVFTPFFRKASALPVNKPKTNPHTNYGKIQSKQQTPLKSITKKIKAPYNESIQVKGSRTTCQEILSNLRKYNTYETTRDLPSIPGTTRLSAYIKFGLCSIREAHTAIEKQLGKDHQIIRQLYWRDFYTHIAYHFPHVFKRAFKPRYDAIPWNYDKILFEAWRQGRTGFPIVDAGMRELNSTGWMHNRVRMIVASFLTKDLHIDWRWGERYFAQQLVDYDPAVNNGNWQWAASTGVDAQPYFRIFNPWRQQEKYDPDCKYIRRWIPELTMLESKIIHNWFKPTKWDSETNYPKPIVNHRLESQYSKELFAATFKNQ